MINTKTESYAIVIPSLNPDKRFLNFMTSIKEEILLNKSININIIVVNDGTNLEFIHFYDEAQKILEFTLLTHATNLGKGRAIKTAINHILLTFPNIQGILFADCDGQHLAKDCFSCIEAAIQNPDSLVLGIRDFSESGIPLKNKTGNILTKHIFHFLCGIKVQDTQTGLRVLPKQFLIPLLNVKGERFEYEMYMLLATKEFDIPIFQQPITVIYKKDEYTSHFNPIIDSIKIYSIFLKFIFSGLSSFGIDIFLFALFINLFQNQESYILLATLFARLFSSIYNYFINRKIVFKVNQSFSTFFRYYFLVVFQAITSGFFVTYLCRFFPNLETLIKIPTDLLLFLFSFFIQQVWVFGKRKQS